MQFSLPVSVVAGYLGSGKTRYINHKLKDAKGLRYAVLVNDFGDLNIDADLIQSQNANSIKLINGCVCCSISNDLDAVLEQLSQTAENFDWVLLEASGIADATKVKSLDLNWPGFEWMDTITLVDTSRIKTLLKDKFIGAHVRQQICNAEQLHFTKLELMSKSQIEAFEGWFKSYFEALLKEGTPTELATASNKDNPGTHPKFYSSKFETLQAVTRASLEQWLEELNEHVCRLKGFVLLIDDPETRYLLQFMDKCWSLEALSAWPTRSRTRLTLITNQPLEIKFPQ